MTEKEEIMIEEILLGYLRSSKKIKLEQFHEEEGEGKNKYSLSFLVDKDFGTTLINSLNNQFSAFFNKNIEQNENQK